MCFPAVSRSFCVSCPLSVSARPGFYLGVRVRPVTLFLHVMQGGTKIVRTKHESGQEDSTPLPCLCALAACTVAT